VAKIVRLLVYTCPKSLPALMKTTGMLL